MNILSRVTPLLNKYVPPALAIKGLSKLDNNLGSFIQNAISTGYTTDSVLDFLRGTLQSPGDRKEMKMLEGMEESGNIHPEQQRSLNIRKGQETIGKGVSALSGLAGGLAGIIPSQEPGNENQSIQTKNMAPPIPQKDNRNIIEQYAPELHQFIDEQIKNGRSPLEAAGIAKVQPKFANAINKLVKDHKTPWASIIESIYGTGERALPEQSENRMQTQPQNQPSQGGQGQQALAAILAQINQKLGPK